MTRTPLPDLPDASSLLSTAWSRDNLVTGHPARFYGGPVREVVTDESLDYVVEELEKATGPVRVSEARLGTFGWQLTVDGADGASVLHVPLAVDDPGPEGRCLSAIPRRTLEHQRAFIERGLTRFTIAPKGLVPLGDRLHAALFPALPDHHPLIFERGALGLRLHRGEQASIVPLGLADTAELLAEMVAALAYLYDPDSAGGTAVTDLSINDGDFVAQRRTDGSFAVRLAALRWLEPAIPPELLLLYFVQLVAYETFHVNGEPLGIPVVVSNPSVAFEGLVRGRRLRHRDLGGSEETGVREAHAWLEHFGRSRTGRAYRPWVGRFLAGRLPLEFGSDLRERWWRLDPLEQKHGLFALRARHGGNASDAAAADAVRAFLDRLALEIGNDLEPSPPQGTGASEAAASIEAPLPEALAGISDGTERPQSSKKPRILANREHFGTRVLTGSLADEAIRTFPSFEAYVDSALHDPEWGYYAHRVEIGRRGHFETHPEALSPHYGRWLATWAFRAFRDLLEHDEITLADRFPVIELGAGTGRLARDFLDAVAQKAADRTLPDREHWRRFGERLDYRIYEISASLRDKQRALLGSEVILAEGDARSPEVCLARDFPNGVRGLVLSNEVPDAFGTHKVLFPRSDEPLATLVVPRVEARLRDALGASLAAHIASADRAVRDAFAFRDHPEESYLDGATYRGVMRALAARSPAERDALVASLWFEEIYVPASLIPELAAHLARHADDYAIALAAEDSGVILYVNLHAARFARGLGAAMAAGFVLTIDYGDTTFGLVRGARRGDFRLRIYGDASASHVPRPNDPYTAPGTQDVTADVDFTVLSRAAAESGLRVLHFGPETDLAGDEIPALLPVAEQSPFDELVGNSVFKVLVLGTRPSRFFEAPLLSPLPIVVSENDLSEAQRRRLPELLRALAGAR